MACFAFRNQSINEGVLENEVNEIFEKKEKRPKQTTTKSK